ncbi:cysteine dioxygenase [Variovorax sp. RHLX14]|uniref:cysteine dioxygenase n=1 Tax=Variovorax sp. RHLX14 TaxID=1259731 RepID=UPI003F48CC89
MTELVDREKDEAPLLVHARLLLSVLLRNDGWLPEAFTVPHPGHYQQYLLHADPAERFSVVSFVWGPGQRTPVHDHTVWGLVGMLRGAETCVDWGMVDGRFGTTGEPHTLRMGDIDAVSPAIGDIHQVANAFADQCSISIHVYGANIGSIARHVFDPVTGECKHFVSGYSSAFTPNLWDRSTEIRRQLSGVG